MRNRIRVAAAMLALLAGCVAPSGSDAPDDGRLRVVTTLFPQYDFARQIAGERAQVTLLLPPGVESHTFEPTPADIHRIHEADLFVFTGAAMEPWAQSILDSAPVRGVDLSRRVALDEEEHSGEEHGHDGHDHGGVDPHIWTSPVNAVAMVEELTDALCEADPAGEAFYRERAASYVEDLDALDATLRELAEGAPRREVVFGSRFAMHYFMKEYHLEPLSAYDSCSEETEPSARAVAQIIDRVRELGIPVIYYEELVDPKVARMIAGETGAKALLMHSCHNVSREELEQGVTYLSLMRQNADHLREGLYG